MPGLPRLKRSQARGSAAAPGRAEPRLAELSANGFTWIHLNAPTPVEAAELAERFGWHPLDLEDVLSKRQRPKIDDYPDEYLFVVLHFPFYDKTVQRLNAAELDMFLGPDFLITLPNVELLPVTGLFARCEDDPDLLDQLFAKGSGYLLYHVLDDMFEGRSEEVVRDISNAKQEIISYRKIIKPERSTLRLLERQVQRFPPQGLELYFDDIVEALEATNESVITHKQNDVLHLLTIISVTLLPLTLISGIFA